MHYEAISGTTIGSLMRDNRDALFIREIATDMGDIVVLFGVADGVTNCPYGGAVARWLQSRILDEIVPLESLDTIKRDVKQFVIDLRKKYLADLAQSEDFFRSGATLSLGSLSAMYAESEFASALSDCLLQQPFKDDATFVAFKYTDE